MKKLLSLILCGVLVLGITGCGNDKTITKGNGNKVNNQEEIEKVVETSYRCNMTYDDDVTYYFYYTDNELNKVELTTIYVEDYADIKEEAEEEYTGVKASKVNDEILIEIDVLNGGIEYLKGETIFYYEEDFNTTWDSVEKIMNANDYQCKLN